MSAVSRCAAGLAIGSIGCGFRKLQTKAALEPSKAGNATPIDSSCGGRTTAAGRSGSRTVATGRRAAAAPRHARVLSAALREIPGGGCAPPPAVRPSVLSKPPPADFIKPTSACRSPRPLATSSCLADTGTRCWSSRRERGAATLPGSPKTCGRLGRDHAERAPAHPGCCRAARLSLRHRRPRLARASVAGRRPVQRRPACLPQPPA